MINVANNIEDLLEILAGLQLAPKMQIDSTDATIMQSIARQVFKGTALTDRQHALMYEKLQSYREQFVENNYEFDNAIDNLRNPLRQIDRSKYIRLVTSPDEMMHHHDDKGQYIKVRFPFKKSDIVLINEINNVQDYFHSKGTHEHFFALTEQNLYNVISRFKDKQYEIDQELLEIYNKIVEIKENKEQYVCGIFNNTVLNMHTSIQELASQELGSFTARNKLHYIDRSRRYGINIVDSVEPNTLTEKIAYRNSIDYHSKPSQENISDVLSSIWNLERFPLLVVLDRSHSEDQLHEMITFYRDILPYESQSVLFRQEGNSGFNQLVKDRKLNNWVDKNTKVVYISNDKLPKLLLKDNWKPFTTFSYTSTVDTTVDLYTKFNCDLIVYREEMLSPMRRYSRYYG